jgi:hypothetical protein
MDLQINTELCNSSNYGERSTIPRTPYPIFQMSPIREESDDVESRKETLEVPCLLVSELKPARFPNTRQEDLRMGERVEHPPGSGSENSRTSRKDNGQPDTRVNAKEYQVDGTSLQAPLGVIESGREAASRRTS